MDITEKAKAYAEGKALSAINTAIEEAYATGYKDGFYDGNASNEKIFINELKTNMEFVDLGLPDKTKWAKDYLRDENGRILYLTFDEASKYCIPTVGQYWDLFHNSDGLSKGFDQDGICHILGRNGNYLNLNVDSIIHGKFPVFWLNSEESDAYRRYAEGPKTKKMFMGKKMPVILVLPAEDIPCSRSV